MHSSTLIESQRSSWDEERGGGGGRHTKSMAKFFTFACIRNESWPDLWPTPHYPSMLKYPKGVLVKDQKNKTQDTESKALFCVNGMTCSACAGSVEKAIKRLPGIQEAIVDVLHNKAQVIFFPSFVSVSYLNLPHPTFCL